MVRRSAASRFMPGAWVFPGGTVDPADHDPVVGAAISGAQDPSLLPWLAAGFREVVEETAIWLTRPPTSSATDRSDVFATATERGLSFPADRTAYFANWITPSVLPVRFDARFFLVAMDRAMEPLPDGEEIDAAEFVGPHEALRRAAAGEWSVPFPTQRVLEQLESFESVAQAIEELRRGDVLPVQPRVRLNHAGSIEVVMPGDPGFDDLADDPPDLSPIATEVALDED